MQAYYTTRPFSTNFPFGSATGVSSYNTEELSFNLEQNYPNPFNPVTTIRYTVPADGKVKMIVYDAVGRQVAVLVNGNKIRGNHTVEFDAGDFRGLSSGVYYYRLETGNYSQIKKMLLVK